MIRPEEKECSYQAASMTVYFFHKSCYEKLLGPSVGGRPNLRKVETKIFEAEDKRREREQKQQWQLTPNITYSHNHQQFREEYMSKPEVSFPPIKDKILAEPIHPKAHVEEFEPSQDTKDDHLNLIIAEIRTRGPLSSEQLEGFLGIKRSTITWRLWDNTVGNTKSKKNQELFYFDKGPKGVQFYGLVNKRIKDPNFFAKARLEQQAKENGISYEEAKTLYDVNFLGDDTDYPMTTITEGAKEKPYSIDDIKQEEEE